jgi:hypothetical protein
MLLFQRPASIIGWAQLLVAQSTPCRALRPQTARIALARSPLNPHISGMHEPHTEFEPIQLKDYSGWQVLITLSRGEQHRISSFKTEAEARTWIGENSDMWLRTYTGDAYV